MTSLRSLALASCLVASIANAQGPSTPALSDPFSITFQDLYDAENLRWYSLNQVRFVRSTDTRNGQLRWMGLAEQLSVSPASTNTTPVNPAQPRARFDLQLISRIGVNTEIEARHANVHGDERAYLYQHASFHVQDPVLAAANYSLHYQGVNTRVGRPVFNMAVVPSSPEKSVWLLELDIETGYPLSRIEYTPAGEVVSMLTVTNFAHGSAAQTAIGTNANWWTPTHRSSFPSVTAAMPSLSTEGKMHEPKALPTGYTQTDMRVTTDIITGESTLVFEYTDGLETMHFLQFPNATPMYPTRRRDEYAILEFTDLQRRHMTFYMNKTQFLVIGSPTDSAMESFTHRTMSDVIKGS